MASPSKNQNYAYLSRLSTQKLLELLAAAPAPAETPEDKAYIDAIVEVVLEREERHPTGLLPDPEQAWEEFQQYYNTPEGEDLSLYPAENPGTAPSEPAPSQTEYRPQRRPKRHFFRRVVIVAAVVVCIALPPALGFENVFQMFGAWTDEVFVFTGNGKNGLIREYEDLKVLNKEYQNLKDTLDAVNIGTDIIPNWLPDGFSEDTISVNELSGINRIEVRAYYTNQESVITIAYSRIPDDTREGTSTFEKDDIAVEELEIGGITHYIFENLGVRTAVWSKENIECSISGDISDSDIKQMIYSIYEEGNQKVCER